MYQLLMIGLLSYAGIALIVFFILSFFIKQQNILTKIQKIEYQNIKLEITLNILVFIAGLLFLYFDYTNNYRELDSKYSEAQREKNNLKDALSRVETVNYEFEVKLEPIDTSNNFPEVSDLECYYQEKEKSAKKRALIDTTNGGDMGTYKIFIFNISKAVGEIPFLEVKDRKGNVWGWGDEDDITIQPPLINLDLKRRQ